MNARIIAVAQQKGGAGKTTITAHVAVALSQMGHRVAVVDIDPQGSLTHWFSIREKLGDSVFPLTFAAISGWRVHSELDRLKRTHDVILIDSPPHTETDARTAIRAASLMIVPIQPSPLDLWATQATLKIAKEERVPVKMVLNRVNPLAKLSKAMMDEIPELSQNRLGNRVLYAGAMTTGKGVTEIAPYSSAGEEVLALAEEVADTLKLSVQKRKRA